MGSLCAECDNFTVIRKDGCDFFQHHHQLVALRT